MSLASKGRHVVGVLLITAAAGGGGGGGGGGAHSASNPINENYVQLSAADWEAVCTSGTTAAGCFGNVDSVGYKKLDRLLGHPATQLSLKISYVPSSIFVRQYGPDGATPASPGTATIGTAALPPSITAVCSSYTRSGEAVGLPGVLTLNGTAVNGGYAARSGGVFWLFNTGGQQNVLLSLAAAVVAPDASTPKNPTVPVYGLCFGLLTAGSNGPQSLLGMSLT